MFRRLTSAEKPSSPDDVTQYEPVKLLGIFALNEVDPSTKDGARLSRMYSHAKVIQDPTRPFIDLHLRPGADLDNVGPQAIRESLGKVADYISAHPDKLGGQDVVGVTYPRLGQLATKLGFRSDPIDGDNLPRALSDKINEITGPYGHASRADAPAEVKLFEDGAVNYSAQGEDDTKMFGEFAAVHQSGKDLVARFGGQNER